LPPDLDEFIVDVLENMDEYENKVYQGSIGLPLTRELD
ncbi:unnamed protein product, partial [Didymodactylos carnosus]